MAPAPLATKLCIVLLLALVLAHSVRHATASSTDQARLAVRAGLSASDLSKIKGGILVKNGKQTSCGLGLLDNQASLLSADCLDYKDGVVDQSTLYEVYIDAAYNDVTSRAVVQNITVHPKFDPSTKANNVALVQFNIGTGNVTWYNYNAIGRNSWTKIVYSQRYVSDVNSMTWATPQVIMQSPSDSVCGDLSPLYQSNPQVFTCNSINVASPSTDMNGCNVPYQVAYAVIDQGLYQAGFLSHSVVQGGSNMCNYTTQRSYYTMIDDYMMFASNVLGRTLYYYRGDNTTLPQPDPNFAMSNPSAAVPSNATVVGGDYYARQTGSNHETQIPSHSPLPTSTSSSSTPGSSTSTDVFSTSVSSNTASSLDPVAPEDTSSGGLSKTGIIIVAASCSAGVVLAALLLFFIIKRRRAKQRRKRVPLKDASAQLILASDLGGAFVPGHEQASADIVESTTYYQPPPAYPIDERPPFAATHARTVSVQDDFDYSNHIHIPRDVKF